MDDRKLVATTVSSRAVGIRRRMEGMTMRSQEEPKTCKEQENESARGRGAGRQSLKHIDGDVPMCMRNKDKGFGMKSKKIEKNAEEDIVIVSLKVTCHRVKRNQKKTKEQQQQRKCDGGSKKTTKDVESENTGTNSSSTKANKITSETKSEKDNTFIVIQKNVSSLNSSERFDGLIQEVEGCMLDAVLISATGEQALSRFGRHNKDTYSWALENSRTNTELEFCEEEVAKTYQLDRLHQRTRHISTSVTVNKQHVLLMGCLLRPLRICGPPR